MVMLGKNLWTACYEAEMRDETPALKGKGSIRRKELCIYVTTIYVNLPRKKVILFYLTDVPHAKNQSSPEFLKLLLLLLPGTRKKREREIFVALKNV